MSNSDTEFAVRRRHTPSLAPHLPPRSNDRRANQERERSVPIRGALNNTAATCHIARFLVLAAESAKQPIIAYIASPKGSVADGLTVISTMNGIRCPIVTFSSGAVGGPAIALSAHGMKGYRVAAPNALFSFKDLSSLNVDWEAPGYELTVLGETLARDTGKPLAEVLRWMREGVEFDADQAVKQGLVDLIESKAVCPPVT